jgi:hypothetical protein
METRFLTFSAVKGNRKKAKRVIQAYRERKSNERKRKYKAKKERRMM